MTQPEVLQIDQDPLGFQAIKAADDGNGRQVWYKPLHGAGARAVGLLNRGSSTATITVNWADIALAAGSASVRDVWARADRGTFADRFSVNVPAHGLALLRVVGRDLALHAGALSDQPWTYASNGWGPVERNQSNGEQAAGDGKTITLHGVTFAKGFGTNSPAAIEVRPNGACSHFSASIGIDDEVAGKGGSVVFQVWADGALLFDSGIVTSSTATKQVSLDITGRAELRLQVNGGLDTANFDHADWANPVSTCP